MSDRVRYWQRQVAAWEKSGLSQAEFCRRRQIDAGSFGWWKRRLAGTAKRARRRVVGNPGRSKTHKHADFVEFALPNSAGVVRSATKPAFAVGATGMPGLTRDPCGYEVALNNGRVIRLPQNFDPAVVAQLVTAVESASSSAGINSQVESC